jgi:HlyD family secretion protein
VAALEAERATARLPARPDAIRAAGSNVEAAQAALEQAEWRLSQRTITAPAGGLVEQLVRNPGEWVPANGVVASLLPPERLRVVFFTPEKWRDAVKLGAQVGLACTGCPTDLKGRVRFLSTVAEYAPPIIYSRETNEKLVFRAEAVLDPASLALHPGQPVSVRLVPP